MTRSSYAPTARAKELGADHIRLWYHDPTEINVSWNLSIASRRLTANKHGIEKVAEIDCPM
jgi:hypothetical protein